MNEVVIKDSKIFIDGTEIKGVLKRTIDQKSGLNTITLVFHANISFRA